MPRRIAYPLSEGHAAAEAKGKPLGRPKGALGKSKLDGKEQDIRALLGKDVSKASMACAGKDQSESNGAGAPPAASFGLSWRRGRMGRTEWEEA